MSKRKETDEMAMRLTIRKLESLGWSVQDLNAEQRNYPNSDLKVAKGEVVRYVQVKGKQEKGPVLSWVSVGYCSSKKVAAGKLFNTAGGGHPCDIILSVVMPGGSVYAQPRFFVFPVKDAEEIFLTHAKYHIAQPTQNGGKRSGSIELAVFVGPGTHNVSNILDQQKRVRLYENAFHHL